MSELNEDLPKPQPERRVWLEVTLGVIALFLFVGIPVIRYPRGTTKGEVIETRIGVVGPRDRVVGEPGEYQIEAHVRFEYRGKAEDRWVPASEHSTRPALEARLADMPKTCEVYWVPKAPEQPRCRFEAQSK
jgi:hypothetical protein